ncbi:AraC family transcriptional regulator [Paenibacillus sp. LHD-117]|uniref:helix-turn-helix transcriptional regulator n=1 Tax=Paenibacillus sp. LHD-117 TaxID=3071412 RepID=UPI0027E1637A|nr:AraC family transcriptional regulator [Paenibacillus sp. LHD-117]MDQ6420558.1 AraC family transcriptional regulator [Paenibacillus sp. LHD-117]
MMNGSPERLLGSNYLTLSSQYRLFKHVISDKIDTHWHDFFEMGCIVSGMGWHIVNGQPFRLQPGMVFLLTPADFHELYPDEGQTIELFDFIFDDSFIRPAIHESLFGHSGLFLHTFEGEGARRLEAEFSTIWDETQHWQFGSDIVVQGSFERILVHLARQLGANRSDDKAGLKETIQPSIRKALLYIQHHFREPVTLAVAADYAGLSANYFSECFRKQVGLSYQEYLNDRRLQFASALLRSSELPVTEVCFAAGFNTIPHFDRVFKRKFGSSPREYRKQRG